MTGLDVLVERGIQNFASGWCVNWSLNVPIGLPGLVVNVEVSYAPSLIAQRPGALSLWSQFVNIAASRQVMP